MCGDECFCGAEPQSKSQPGNSEVQRLQREATKSKPGETPGADRDDGPEPGTEGV